MTPARRTLDLGGVRVVSWDVDGTLYSLRRMKWYLRIAMANEHLHGRGRVAKGDMAALRARMTAVNVTRPSGGALDEALRVRCLDPEALARERLLLAPAIARAGPRTGVRATLDALNARGITQVVLSDYTAGYKLDALGIRERFTAVYEGVRIGHVKPGAAGFERISADLEVPPSSILHFGDRDDADGAAARAAGCQVLIIGKDFRTFRELYPS